MKKKIAPQHLTKDYMYASSHGYHTYIKVPGVGKTTRDNDRFCKKETGAGCSNASYIVRVPSLSRSDRTWKNFYRLFPRYLYIMQTALHNGDSRDGVVLYRMPKRVCHMGSNSACVKLKVVDMGDIKLTMEDWNSGRPHNHTIMANDLWKFSIYL